MISRYDVSDISFIWTDENKFKTYLDVELAVLKALEGDLVPKGTAEKIQKKAVINPKRIEEIEKTTKHDVIAFCTSITENLDSEVSRFFHYGVTSSDIIDTSFMLMIKSSLEVILKDISQLKETLKKRAIEFKDVLSIGRSHGIYAEPLSFGQKILSFYAELDRREKDLTDFFENEITGQISGAVGNYTILSRNIELKALTNLGLKRENISTQIIPRDRIAKLINIHGLLASMIERLAVEIRHLHRSEVGEVFEGFSKGQKGSSIMPHKKNPISGENLTGISRVLRSHVQLALENCVLWHERDISHSSAERLFLPDNLGLVSYALRRLNSTMENLVVKTEVIEKRVDENFNYLSSYYLHQMLAKLTISREGCYAIVQKAAFDANSAHDFHQSILDQLNEKDLTLDELKTPSRSEMKKLYMKEVDSLFNDLF